MTVAPTPKWVMFSDDDDIWSEYRTELYAQQCVRAPPSVRAVLCRRKSVPLAAYSASHSPKDAPSVRSMLAAGRARYTDANKKDGLAELVVDR